MTTEQKYIYIVDVTNRDGVQTSRLGLAKLQKTIINLMLDDMGITQSEFGFPTTKHESNYLNGNLELVDIGAIHKTRLGGWMRGIKSDVVESFQAVPRLKHINLSVSTSDQMIMGKYGGKKTFEEIIDNTNEALEAAHALGALSIGVNAEDASRTKLENLIRFATEAKSHGATKFRYCDTLGFDNPHTAYTRIFEIAKATNMDIELHFHNDLGMAVGNSIMGAKAAAPQNKTARTVTASHQ